MKSLSVISLAIVHVIQPGAGPDGAYLESPRHGNAGCIHSEPAAQLNERCWSSICGGGRRPDATKLKRENACGDTCNVRSIRSSTC